MTWRFGAVAYTALILVLTLAPGGSEHEGWIRGCLVCGSQGWADAVRNVLLFVPLGFALTLGWGRGPWTLLLCLALTVTIESLQILVPGRDSNVGDILFNGIGATVGFAWGATSTAWWTPSAVGGRRLALAWGFGVSALVLASAWAASPSALDERPIGQWTPRPRGTVPYTGLLLSAHVGDRAIPAWYLPSEEEAVTAWNAGEPVRLRMQAGLPPDGHALLVRVVAASDELLSVGLVGTDGVVRMRSRLADARLHDPFVRLPSLMAGVSAGDTVEVSVRRDGDRFCGTAGASHGAQTPSSETCVSGMTLGSVWAAFVPREAIARPFGAVLTVLWLAGLAVPLGWWIGSSAGLGAGALLGAVAWGAAWVTPMGVRVADILLLCALGLLGGGLRSLVEGRARRT